MAIKNNIDLLKKTCDKECNHKKTCVQIFNENINKYSNNRIKLCTELEQFRQKYIDSHECDKCLDVPFLNNLPNEVNAEKVYTTRRFLMWKNKKEETHMKYPR
ncbi:hypothetical protein POCGH01_00238100 [Plasmodium ovale]|uniref:PIR protein n=1 Tax=Plasmodium ovale TaxID=36330 RepID=A0A1D3JFZ6_PLAOA|nr:hypothetical protein POCGH01_00238100 [Plasmodium ovale]